MYPELTILIKLLVFAVVCIANAYAIIAFHRSSQYEVYETDQHFQTEEGSVKMVPRGTIIPESKMILWWVKYWSDELLGKFWSKPVYSCPTCMASVHGVIPFLLTAAAMTGFEHITFLHWAFYTLALSGYVTILNER